MDRVGLEWAEGQVGRLLGQRWTLLRCIGVGGTAAVFEGQHRNGKRVAIKVLRPEHAGNEARARRFLREGYTANRVQHPRVVSIDDDHREADGTAFLVMDLLSGEPLDQLARRLGGRLPWPQVTGLLRDLLEVLEASHARGIVHRDLKPANLFLEDGRGLRVLDFGLARVESEPLSIQDGALVGTPAFMAPEQARGAVSAVGPCTDLWAAGAVAFALITGRKVYEGATPEQQLALASSAPPPSLASLAPEVPRALSDVLQHALAYETTERYHSAGAMREALEAALTTSSSARAVSAERLLSDERTQSSPPTIATVALSAPRALPSRSRRAVLLVSLLVLGGVWLAAADLGTRANTAREASASVAASVSGAAQAVSAVTAPQVGATSAMASAAAPAPASSAASAPNVKPARPRRRREVAAPESPPAATAPVRAGGAELVGEPPF